MGALERADGEPEFIQVRHEEMAAFMACAHAKFTGEVGVCLATSGPGAIHLLNGLYDAKMDHQPVLAIVGQQARDGARRRATSRKSTCITLFKDVAGEYVQHGDACPRRSATWSTAPCASRWTSARSPASSSRTTCRSWTRCESPPRAHGTIHSGVGYAAPRVVPQDGRPAARRRRAQRRQAGGHAGRRRARWAPPTRCSRSPSCSAPASPRRCSARRCVPDDLPFVTGSIGLLGHPAELGA